MKGRSHLSHTREIQRNGTSMAVLMASVLTLIQRRNALHAVPMLFLILAVPVHPNAYVSRTYKAATDMRCSWMRPCTTSATPSWGTMGPHMNQHLQGG